MENRNVPGTSRESTLQAQLTRQGLKPIRWSNDPDAVYGEHAHPYGKVLVVVSGSITFTINGGTRVVAMKPEDRLELPRHTPHSAVVGPDGVVCFEAHLATVPGTFLFSPSQTSKGKEKRPLI